MYYTDLVIAKDSNHAGSKALYLDGLRGFAALVVTIFHVLLTFYRDRLTFGYNLAGHAPLTIIFNGRFMVSVFFVLSGRVLVQSMYEPTSKRSGEEALATLGSHLVRRPLRLFLPLYITFLGFWLLSCSPLLEITHKLFDIFVRPEVPKTNVRWTGLGAARNDSMPTPLTFITYLWFNQPARIYEYTVIWTLPIELWGSYIVYFFSIFTPNHPVFGLMVLSASATFITFYGFLYNAHFVTGLSLCHWRNLFAAHTGRSDNAYVSNSWIHRFGSLLHRAFVVSCAILAIIAASYGNHMTGFDPIIQSFTDRCIDADRLKLLGAFASVYWLDNDITGQMVFSSTLMRYFGKISFGMYLLHPAVLTISMTLGISLLKTLFPALGYGYTVVMSSVPAFLLLLWLSNLFAKHLDRHSIKYSRMVSDLCFKASARDNVMIACRRAYDDMSVRQLCVTSTTFAITVWETIKRAMLRFSRDESSSRFVFSFAAS